MIKILFICHGKWFKGQGQSLILLGFLDRNVKFTPYLHLWKIGSE